MQFYGGLITKINFAVEAKELDEKTGSNTHTQKNNLEAHSNRFLLLRARDQ